LVRYPAPAGPGRQVGSDVPLHDHPYRQHPVLGVDVWKRSSGHRPIPPSSVSRWR